MIENKILIGYTHKSLLEGRVGRVVECTAFEKQNPRKGITGSNPVPSADLRG